jgi:hypothetical protein
MHSFPTDRCSEIVLTFERQEHPIPCEFKSLHDQILYVMRKIPSLSMATDEWNAGYATRPVAPNCHHAPEGTPSTAQAGGEHIARA